LNEAIRQKNHSSMDIAQGTTATAKNVAGLSVLPSARRSSFYYVMPIWLPIRTHGGQRQRIDTVSVSTVLISFSI